MAQSYFAKSHPSVAPVEPTPAPKDNQDAYIEHRDGLLTALDLTKDLLGDLRGFNKNEWVVRYPQFRPLEEEPAEASESADSASAKPSRRHARRSLSFLDDPSNETQVVFSPAKNMMRSLTLATVADLADEKEADGGAATEEPAEGCVSAADPSDFRLLRLDLKLGPHGSSTSPAALVSQLEKTSIANLLDERLGASLGQLDKLRLRIEDTASKVLVTGDLNAGKSTFVNALLRREVMPVDQQPCTTAFFEVHDASENAGVEEVHILKDGVEYSPSDESTFTRAKLGDLEDFVSENENSQQKVKVYLVDKNAQSDSLLNNGVVDISLIDAPGLNRDSVKTTAIFSRQEEIDVIVFVVSAENHFTLSAKEFLSNASHEKAYVFIVVNKYEGIRDKKKCRRLVLEQIKQLSPRTYENADELVHFVDSAHGTEAESFTNLQTALRSFILEKRETSKLAPATHYLSNLLSDVELLVGANAIVAQAELDRTAHDLARVRPEYEKMKSGRTSFEEGLEGIEDSGAREATERTKKTLDDALTLVGQGRLATGKAVRLPTYPGLLGIWTYVYEVRHALLASLDAAVKEVEDAARRETAAGVDRILAHGEAHLPAGAERSRRVFVPEAMFGGARAGRDRKSKRLSAYAGLGVQHLGLGLAQRADLLAPRFADVLDAQYHFHAHFGGGGSSEDADGAKGASALEDTTALGVASVGVGALTMVCGKAFGLRSLVESVLHLSDLWHSETARRWAAPVLGAVALGGTAYFVLELPQSVPRNVGRRIRRELVRPAGAEGGGAPAPGFVDAHAERVARETRKVLRLASWDTRERYNAALDEREREVEGAQERMSKAQGAVTYFRGVEQRAGEVRRSAGLVSATL